MTAEIQNNSSIRPNIKVFGYAFLFGAALASTPSHAQKLSIGCSLISHYSGAEVNYMIDRARSAVGEAEASALAAKYSALKSECRANQSASRDVYISPAMQKLLDGYGVNVSSYVAQR
jgi:hypothetical protein